VRREAVVASDQEDIAQLKFDVARPTRLDEALYARSGEPMPNLDVSLENPPADVVATIRDGQLITAIKLWRDYTGLGLAEAKAEMDALAARLGV
jgi:ribosomal protein L7/L12